MSLQGCGLHLRRNTSDREPRRLASSALKLERLGTLVLAAGGGWACWLATRSARPSTVG